MKFLSKVFLLAFVGLLSGVHIVFAVDEAGNATPKFPNPFGNTQYTDSLYGFVYFVLTNIVLPIGSVVVVFFVIYAGYMFVTARGSEDKLTTAKHALLGVVIGAVILLGSIVIAKAIKGTICQISNNSIPDLCNGSGPL